MLVRFALRRVYGQDLDALGRHHQVASECSGAEKCLNLKEYYRGDSDSKKRGREKRSAASKTLKSAFAFPLF